MRAINILLLFAVLPIFPCIALAESPPPARAADAGQRAEIIEDQEAGAFRFTIDGQEVARLDTVGLHVRGSVEYGGAITDTGAAAFPAAEGDDHAR